jgi:hypothetical protein
VPYDLKVTYLPEGYIKDFRRESELRPELTLLRQSARRLAIPFDATMAEARLLEDLWAKHRDNPDPSAQRLVSQLRRERLEILEAAQNDPTTLVRWFYENQGTRRFDASNRLFLVLVDTVNFFESWKLKRARPLLCNRLANPISAPVN